MKKTVTIVAGLCVGSVAALTFDRRLREVDTGKPVGTSATAKEAHDEKGTLSSEAFPRVARERPPKFVAHGASARVETDPRSPAYNPVKLADIGIPLVQIAAAEPRIETWAAPVEKLLSARIEQDIAHFSPRARLASVDCRSSSCTITVDAPAEDVKWVSNAIMIGVLGETFDSPTEGEASKAGWTRLSMVTLFGSETRDLGTAVRLQQRRRREALDRWRKEPARLAESGIDPNRLPPYSYPSDLPGR